MAAVYILHFDKKISDHAQHYVGFANDVEKRVKQHQDGCNGARLVQVASERGIGFRVARIFENVDRTFERNLKRQKNTKRFCPICREGGAS